MRMDGVTRMSIAWLLAIAAIALAGCGDSGSSGPSEAQLEAARKQGEEAAHERDRINSLQKQVRGLKHRAKQQGATVAPPSESGAETVTSESGPTVLRAFHAPSGNVSCEILSNGALCSVSSIATTFAFSDGQAAQIEAGASLSRGAGELAAYGSTISAGSITCTVPSSDEPHGIVCTDGDSGHGFEASRVSSRQHAY